MKAKMGKSRTPSRGGSDNPKPSGRRRGKDASNAVRSLARVEEESTYLPTGARPAQERRHPGDALWAENTNSLSVLVRDDGTDDQFELSVELGADALDTFEHPYAYAAWRAGDYRVGDLRGAA